MIEGQVLEEGSACDSLVLARGGHTLLNHKLGWKKNYRLYSRYLKFLRVFKEQKYNLLFPNNQREKS